MGLNIDPVKVQTANVEYHPKHMFATAQLHGGHYRLPLSPPTGVGHTDRAGDVLTINQDPHFSPAVRSSRHSSQDCTCHWSPRSPYTPAIHRCVALGEVTDARIARIPDIHVVRAVFAAIIARGRVVIGGSLATSIVILGLYRAGHSPWLAAVWLLASSGACVVVRLVCL